MGITKIGWLIRILVIYHSVTNYPDIQWPEAISSLILWVDWAERYGSAPCDVAWATLIWALNWAKCLRWLPHKSDTLAGTARPLLFCYFRASPSTCDLSVGQPDFLYGGSGFPKDKSWNFQVFLRFRSRTDTASLPHGWWKEVSQFNPDALWKSTI